MQFSSVFAGLILALPFLFSCQTISSQRGIESPKRSLAGTFDSHVDNSPEANFTCKEIFETLQASNPPLATIEQTLHALHTKRPDYFKRYVLLPNSESLHGSSPANPRALVYGGNAKTIISFNGAKDQLGYERLEIMCFQDKQKKFEFYDVAFPKEARHVSSLQDLTAEEKALPFAISPVNGRPRRNCLDCHQSPARPNWDTYPVWPSAIHPHQEGNPEIYAAEQRLVKAFEANATFGRYFYLNTQDGISGSPDPLGRLLTKYNYSRIVQEFADRSSKSQKAKRDFAKSLFCKSDQLLVDTQSGGVTARLPLSPQLKQMVLTSLAYHENASFRLKNYLGLSQDPSLTFFNMDPTYYKNEGLPADYSNYLGRVDFDLLVQLLEIDKVVRPLGINIKNWSMVLYGGYEFEEGQIERLGPLEKIFVERFYSTHTFVRERVEDSYASQLDRLQKKSEICNYFRRL